MKHFFVLGFIFTIFIQSYAQDLFKVISVNGEILAQKAKLKLQSGIDIQSDEKFVFVLPNSRAALINPKLGRVILTEQNANNAFSKAAFAPPISTTATRGISKSLFDETSVSYSLNNNAAFVLVNSLNQLKNIFSEELIVIDRLELKLNIPSYPVNNNQYFFIRYLYKGEEINKKIKYKGDTLIIDKKDLYTVDGQPIPNPDVNEMKLYYYEVLGENAKLTQIASFNLIFIDGELLKNECSIILEALKNQPKDRKIQEIYDYVSTYYAPIDYEYLKLWLSNHFDLK